MGREEYYREIRRIVESHGSNISSEMDSLSRQCIDEGGIEPFVRDCECVCDYYLSIGYSYTLENFQHLSIVAYHGAKVAENKLEERSKRLYEIAADASLKVSIMARDFDTRDFASFLRKQFLQKVGGGE